MRATDGGRLQLGPEEAPQIVVEISPNALPKDTTISIQELSVGDLPDGVAALEPVGRAYRLELDGLQLAAPATVTLAFDAEDLAAFDLAIGAPVFVGLLLSSDRTIDFLRNSVTTVDLATGSIILTGETAHFTDVVASEGPLEAKLEPREVGPLPRGATWDGKVTVTNESIQGQATVTKFEYRGTAIVDTVGPNSAAGFVLRAAALRGGGARPSRLIRRPNSSAGPPAQACTRW